MLLAVQDAGPEEVLDCFIYSLAPLTWAQVLLLDLDNFNRAELLVERVFRAHNKPNHYPILGVCFY